MQRFFQTGHAFFLVAVVSLAVSALTKNFAAGLSLAVVFFILGLAVRKKHSQQSSEATPKV